MASAATRALRHEGMPPDWRMGREPQAVLSLSAEALWGHTGRIALKADIPTLRVRKPMLRVRGFLYVRTVTRSIGRLGRLSRLALPKRDRFQDPIGGSRLAPPG